MELSSLFVLSLVAVTYCVAYMIGKRNGLYRAFNTLYSVMDDEEIQEITERLKELHAEK
jgi:hypothetical protein